jgi:hypothetical protein
MSAPLPGFPCEALAGLKMLAQPLLGHCGLLATSPPAGVCKSACWMPARPVSRTLLPRTSQRTACGRHTTPCAVLHASATLVGNSPSLPPPLSPAHTIPPSLCGGWQAVHAHIGLAALSRCLVGVWRGVWSSDFVRRGWCVTCRTTQMRTHTHTLH